MRFGFDIDDTLISLREYGFTIYNEKLNKNVPLDTFRELNRVEIHQLFGLTDEQGKEMWKQSQEEIFYGSCPPYQGALEMVQKLEREGHEIYYITARHKEHGERTKNWMKEQGFPVRDDRFFYGMLDEEKVQIIKELKLDYYFDDKPKVLNTLLNESVKVFVKDQAYNRHVELPRIVNWNELEEIINRVD
jgi:uncharacterized HAD superfamily protein